MAISKVVLNGVTQMDVTNVTATAATIRSTYTALDASGQLVTGTYEGGGGSPTISSLTVSPSTVSQTFNSASVDGYKPVTVNAMPAGAAFTPATTITANPTISINATGLITATASTTSNVTPTVTAGYIANGTAGTITVSGTKTSQLTTIAATTYNVSTANQTISSARYLTGTQTIRGVTTTNLSASNILSGVTIQVGDSNNASRIATVTGNVAFVTYYTGSSAPSSSLGTNGDIYLQS